MTRVMNVRQDLGRFNETRTKHRERLQHQKALSAGCYAHYDTSNDYKGQFNEAALKEGIPRSRRLNSSLFGLAP